MYVHRVVRRRHPLKPWLHRRACLCGWRTDWIGWRAHTNHPDGMVTMSAKDHRAPGERVPVQYVSTLADDTWLVVYVCGHMVHGVDDFDRRRAWTSHTVAECQQQSPSAAAAGTGLQGDR